METASEAVEVWRCRGPGRRHQQEVGEYGLLWCDSSVAGILGDKSPMLRTAGESAIRLSTREAMHSGASLNCQPPPVAVGGIGWTSKGPSTLAVPLLD